MNNGNFKKLDTYAEPTVGICIFHLADMMGL